MKGRILTSEAIQNFKKYLKEEEKSKNTIREVYARCNGIYYIYEW